MQKTRQTSLKVVHEVVPPIGTNMSNNAILYFKEVKLASHVS